MIQSMNKLLFVDHIKYCIHHLMERNCDLTFDFEKSFSINFELLIIKIFENKKN
jgi:hypothetical protein